MKTISKLLEEYLSPTVKLYIDIPSLIAELEARESEIRGKYNAIKPH